MPTATEIVQEIIKCQEDRVSTSWPHPERRLALLEICRAIDIVVLSAKHQREEVVELCRQGANKAVSLFVDDSCNESRTPLFASNDATFRWAQSALQLCGQIASCEKLLDYEQSGLGEFSGHREALRFDFTALNAGMEALEQEDFERLVDSQGHVRRPLYDAMDSVLPQVHERMRSLVYRWSDHYIGYTAEPEIDAYYQQRGLLAAERMSAQDTFDDASEFGGLPFGLYKAVVLVLVGWTIKHADFALILKEQYPDLHLQNLVTVERNPIKLVRQSAKREKALTYLNFRNSNFSSASCPSGSARWLFSTRQPDFESANCLALRWSDVDFENLELRVTRSIWHQVVGNCKTEASAKPVPMDSYMAEDLLRWRRQSPYPMDDRLRLRQRDDEGKAALLAGQSHEALISSQLRRQVGINKNIGWHTFRHSFGTLLKANGEDVKTVQELLRHANSRITLDVYTQAVNSNKRAAQSKVVRMMVSDVGQKCDGEKLTRKLAQ